MTNVDVIDFENNRRDRDLVHSLEGRARICAAITSLQEACDQASGLESIREIAANLLGSEQIAVFKVDNEKAALWLYWCTGIDPNKYGYLDVMREPKLEEVLAGEIIFLGEDGNEQLLSLEDPVSALVPILFHDEVVAVIVIFRLLPQKEALDAVDRQICHFLSTRAGRAIRPVVYKRLGNKMDGQK